MKYPEHPTHYFTVSRVFNIGGVYSWGGLTDGFAETFSDACGLIVDSFDGDDMPLSAETVKVVEIDGNVRIDRTEDAVDRFETFKTTGGYRAMFKGSDLAVEWGFSA